MNQAYGSTILVFAFIQGAGDAFVGAMAYYLACHPSIRRNFPEVVYRAAIIASHTVTLSGTQSSFMTGILPKWLFASANSSSPPPSGYDGQSSPQTEPPPNIRHYPSKQ